MFYQIDEMSLPSGPITLNTLYSQNQSILESQSLMVKRMLSMEKLIKGKLGIEIESGENSSNLFFYAN